MGGDEELEVSGYMVSVLQDEKRLEQTVVQPNKCAEYH